MTKKKIRMRDSTPFPLAKNIIDALPKDYYLTQTDIIRINTVVTLASAMLQWWVPESKWHWVNMIIAAIEHITEDRWLCHFDPYEILIDAWFIDENLKIMSD